jgi:dolichol-phosphate mannosyltransferase
MNPKLSILLPVRNEGMNLKVMLKILRAVMEVPHEVLVVHDDPKDTSIAVVQKAQSEYPNVRLIHNQRGRGVINALKEGVAKARGEFVLIFAADEVGPVLAIEEMLQLASEGCDFISCTRYAHGGRRLGGSFIGGILSRTANYLFHTFTGAVLTDSTTGIKLIRRTLFESLQLESSPVGWVVAFELAIKAQIAGIRLGEVPIVSIDRLYGGKSTFRLGPWVIEYLKWFLWGVRVLWTTSKRSTVTVRSSEYFQGKAA